MNEFRPESRKIDPARRRPDGSPDDNDRPEIGPTPLAFAEWAEAGLEAPDLGEMRRYRHRRMTDGIVARNYGGALFYDPLNIRYVTDSSNMQLWNTHNPFRAVFIAADGWVCLFEYKAGARFLSDFNPAVSEVRGGAGLFYMCNGDLEAEDARGLAGEVADLLREHGAGNMALAVDKIPVSGFRALAAAGIDIHEGEELSEKVRSIKGPDEIRAMRCSMLSTERSCAAMEAAAAPGMTEDDVWAVMHAENIRRGGEWIECRLLTSGPRTNPWFQECGPRVIGNGEIVAYDTDLVGPYGICSDFSRTFWVGDGGPTDEMKRLYRFAHDHIRQNTALLAPGVSFRDLTFGGHHLTNEFTENRYSCKMHGVGLCDEWPFIAYPVDYREGLAEYELEPGMVLCVEALIATQGGDFSIKLEDQVLITETGAETLTTYPFDRRFLDD